MAMAGEDMGFEKALEKLEKIVAELEEGDVSLDASLKRYEEGVKLVRVCRDNLEKAKKKVQLLMKDKNGEFTKKDMETGEE
jgi:exodeoxyribonuclease VII small subunit